jgi:hypothetical protein
MNGHVFDQLIRPIGDDGSYSRLFSVAFITSVVVCPQPVVTVGPVSASVPRVDTGGEQAPVRDK